MTPLLTAVWFDIDGTLLDARGIDWVALFQRLSVEVAALERSVDVEASLPLMLRTP